MATQRTYSVEDLFWILGQSLILLHDKQITVVECDMKEEKEDRTIQASLVDYIVRAVGDELVEKCGETEESIAKALEKTKLDFSEVAYPKKDIGVMIFSRID